MLKFRQPTDIIQNMQHSMDMAFFCLDVSSLQVIL